VTTTYTDYAQLILQQQLSDGAIAMGPGIGGEYSVEPYFANVGLIALFTAPETTGLSSGDYRTCAEKWISWYVRYATLSPENRIRDYVGSTNSWKPDTTVNSPFYYDSVDAYIATFLKLVSLVYTQESMPADVQMFLPAAWEVLYSTMSQAGTEPNLAVDIPGPNSFYYVEDNLEVSACLLAAGNVGGYQGVFADPVKSGKAIDAILDKAPFFQGHATPPHYVEAMAPDGDITDAPNPANAYNPDQQIQLLAATHLGANSDNAMAAYDALREIGLGLPAIQADGDLFDQVLWWGQAAIALDDVASDAGQPTVFDHVVSCLQAYQPTFPTDIQHLGYAANILALQWAIANNQLLHPPMGPHFPGGHPPRLPG
jgi:hypothetical protein